MFLVQFFVMEHKNLKFSTGLQHLRKYFINTYIHKYKVCVLAQMESGKVRIEMQEKNLTKVC